jgi:hypothetical protein
VKTAVLISGQIRNAKECVDSLRAKVIGPYNADVFIDTWTPESKIIDHRGNFLTNDASADEVLSLFKPKIAIFEDFNTSPVFDRFKDHGITNKFAYDGSYAYETRVENIFYMYYKIWRCFQTIVHYENMNGFKYDAIIRMRFDLMFDDFQVIDVQPNTIYIPEGFNHRGGYNDLLSLGSREVMEKICLLCTKLVEYANGGIGFHPESVLRKHIENNGISVVRFPVKYRLRGEYV